jgi:hypothetical protein
MHNKYVPISSIFYLLILIYLFLPIIEIDSESSDMAIEFGNQTLEQSIGTVNTISKTDIEVIENDVLSLDLTRIKQSRCFSAPVSLKHTSNLNICSSEYSTSQSTSFGDIQVEMEALPACPMSPDITKYNSKNCNPPSPGSMETPLQHGPKDLRNDTDIMDTSFSPDKKKRKVQRPLHGLCSSDQGSTGCLKKVRVQIDPATLEIEDCNVVIEEVWYSMNLVAVDIVSCLPKKSASIEFQCVFFSFPVHQNGRKQESSICFFCNDEKSHDTFKKDL